LKFKIERKDNTTAISLDHAAAYFLTRQQTKYHMGWNQDSKQQSKQECYEQQRRKSQEVLAEKKAQTARTSSFLSCLALGVPFPPQVALSVAALLPCTQLQ